MAKKKTFTFDVDEVDPPSQDRIIVASREQRHGFLYVPINQLAPDPGNPPSRGNRSEDEKYTSVLASITRMGVLTPLIVIPITAFPGDVSVFGDDVEYVVIDGNRRFAAATEAGLERLPVVLRPELALSGARTMLHANLTALDLTPMETATAMRSVIDQFGISQKDLADELGLSVGHVSLLLALLELPAPVQDLVQVGKLSARAAYEQKGSAPQVQVLAAQLVDADASVDWVHALRRAGRGVGEERPPTPVSAVDPREDGVAAVPPTRQGTDVPAEALEPGVPVVSEKRPDGDQSRVAERLFVAAARRPTASEWVQLAEAFIVSGHKLDRRLKPRLKALARRGVATDVNADRFHALWVSMLVSGSVAADAGETTGLIKAYLRVLEDAGVELNSSEVALLQAGEQA